MRALRRFALTSPRAAARGQAMVEFALVLALLMVITVTSLQFVPAINARGAVLNAASTAVERANSYLAAKNDTLGAQESTLCNQMLAVVRIELVKAGSPAVTNGVDGCRAGAPDGTHNPVVSVTPDAGVTKLEVAPGQAPKGLTVCVSYQYDFGAGLLWLATRAPGDVGASVQSAFTYKFCGRSILDANRTR